MNFSNVAKAVGEIAVDPKEASMRNAEVRWHGWQLSTTLSCAGPSW